MFRLVLKKKNAATLRSKQIDSCLGVSMARGETPLTLGGTESPGMFVQKSLLEDGFTESR